MNYKENLGKLFEDDFKKSVSEGTYCQRFHDSPAALAKEGSRCRFTPNNPYDFYLCHNGKMIALELKSTSHSYVYHRGEWSLIRPQQLEGLTKVQKAGGLAGLLINFRTEKETYFVEISAFNELTSNSSSFAVQLSQIREIGVLIPATLKRTRYRYDLTPLLNLVEDENSTSNAKDSKEDC